MLKEFYHVGFKLPLVLEAYNPVRTVEPLVLIPAPLQCNTLFVTVMLFVLFIIKVNRTIGCRSTSSTENNMRFCVLPVLAYF